MSASAKRIRQLLSWLGDRDRQLQLALDAAELGTWNWDPVSNELVWSDRCRSLLGMSAEEPATVDNFLKLVHPDDRAAVGHAIDTALRDRDSYSIEYRIVRPDGETRWLHSLGRVHVAGLKGQSEGMSGIVRDVTAVRRAQAQLRHQDEQQRINQRYRLLVDRLPLAIMLADRDGAVTYLNPAWQGLFAPGTGQALGLDQVEVVHPQDRARVSTGWRRLATQASTDFEFRLRSATAEECWVHCLSTALRDVNGDLLGYAHACIDVSRRRSERDANEQRHREVLGLAHRLQRLRLAERLDLAGILQREVLNELAALPDAERALLPAIERLRGIVHELNPPGIEELGLAGALEHFLAQQAEQAGFEFELAMPEAPMLAQPRILGVIYSVAQEAIVNVARHARATRVHVAVRVEREKLQLVVRDNGVGIATDAWPRPHCFGLLAASERLAELGGTLLTTGAAGEGTTLAASIPLLSPLPRQRFGEHN